MNVTYTKTLGRKILLVFMAFTIIFAIVALFVRNSINKKLENVSKLADNIERGQSKPQQALLLLNQANDDFQESLLNTNNKKISDYKIKLSKAFSEIDTLLKLRGKAYTSHLTLAQNNRVKYWYKKKLELSDKLYSLKHNFDSLLNAYADFHSKTDEYTHELSTRVYTGGQEVIKSKVDTVIKEGVEKKKLLRRLKDAIYNKTGGAAIEIYHNKSTFQTDLDVQKNIARSNNSYAQKLHQLQQRNIELLRMQRELNIQNNHISNEMESIINDVKDINYNMSNEFKEMALKNYQETTRLLNKFYMADLFLVMAFAISLIIFIVRINRSELILRKENQQSIISAQQKIDELIKKIVPDDEGGYTSKIAELEEVVHLVMNNNPAFLIKFNEFDSEFIKKLLHLSPTLIATEIEFCVLLRLNFETKEIARYTKTSVRSVEGKKYRIRKKLDIPSDQDINIWMTHI
jgi:DNA-binding CsgD family transcriptional regulator